MVATVAREVGDVIDSGVEICLVIGGGNIFRGVSGAAAGMERATGDYMGMLATVMNALTCHASSRKGARGYLCSGHRKSLFYNRHGGGASRV